MIFYGPAHFWCPSVRLDVHFSLCLSPSMQSAGVWRRLQWLAKFLKYVGVIGNLLLCLLRRERVVLNALGVRILPGGKIIDGLAHHFAM